MFVKNLPDTMLSLTVVYCTSQFSKETRRLWWQNGMRTIVKNLRLILSAFCCKGNESKLIRIIQYYLLTDRICPHPPNSRQSVHDKNSLAARDKIPFTEFLINDKTSTQSTVSKNVFQISGNVDSLC